MNIGISARLLLCERQLLECACIFLAGYRQADSSWRRSRITAFWEATCKLDGPDNLAVHVTGKGDQEYARLVFRSLGADKCGVCRKWGNVMQGFEVFLILVSGLSLGCIGLAVRCLIATAREI